MNGYLETSRIESLVFNVFPIISLGTNIKAEAIENLAVAANLRIVNNKLEFRS